MVNARNDKFKSELAKYLEAHSLKESAEKFGYAERLGLTFEQLRSCIRRGEINV